MNEKDALTAFSALSSAPRLQILKMLVQAGEAGLNAGDISARIDASPSRASFHLASLTKARLVTPHRSARQITYKVDFSTLGALTRFLLDDCCQGHPSVIACCDLKA